MTTETLATRSRWSGVEHPTGKGWLERALPLALTLLGVLALGLFIARAPLMWCVAALVGGVGLWALLMRPAVALYALAFAVPFGSLRELHVGGLTVGASELLVMALVSVWFLRMAATRQVQLTRSRLTLGILCYLAALLIALWPATSMTLAFKELAKWGEFLLVYLFVASTLTPGETKMVAASLLLAGALEGLQGIYQFLFQVGPEGFILNGRYMRAYGHFLQPNPFGGYMGLLLPLAYVLALGYWPEAARAWRRREGWASVGPMLLWALAVIAAVIMGAALLMSWSRGALLGLAAGLACVALALGRRVWLALLPLALVGLLLGPMLLERVPTDLIDRMAEALRYTAGTELAAVEITDANFAIIERLAHWNAAWRMFDSNPWLGAGAGQYSVAYPAVALPRWQDPLGHAHNYYLNTLAEGGLVGLAGYLAFLLTAGVVVWRQARRGQGWGRMVALAALGMLGHLAAHSVVDNLYVHEMYLIVAILLGLVAATLRQGATQNIIEHRRTGVECHRS
jgi:putative inorganic carbon (HCO3(-)) transporter